MTSRYVPNFIFADVDEQIQIVKNNVYNGDLSTAAADELYKLLSNSVYRNVNYVLTFRSDDDDEQTKALNKIMPEIENWLSLKGFAYYKSYTVEYVKGVNITVNHWDFPKE